MDRKRLSDSGVPVLMDDEICDLVSSQGPSQEVVDSEESEDDDDSAKCPITHSDAARMFEWCLSWLEQQPEATTQNTTLLRELHILASKKRMSSLSQKKIRDYFH